MKRDRAVSQKPGFSEISRWLEKSLRRNPVSWVCGMRHDRAVSQKPGFSEISGWLQKLEEETRFLGLKKRDRVSPTPISKPVSPIRHPTTIVAQALAWD